MSPDSDPQLELPVRPTERAKPLRPQDAPVRHEEPANDNHVPLEGS